MLEAGELLSVRIMDGNADSGNAHYNVNALDCIIRLPLEMCALLLYAVHYLLYDDDDDDDDDNDEKKDLIRFRSMS
jgi:hypothetical protein